MLHLHIPAVKYHQYYKYLPFFEDMVLYHFYDKILFLILDFFPHQPSLIHQMVQQEQLQIYVNDIFHKHFKIYIYNEEKLNQERNAGILESFLPNNQNG